MLPKLKQWKKWSLPSKYALVGVILSLLSLLTYFYDKSLFYMDLNKTNESWYVGTWEVDIEKSMPEFKKEYNRYLSAFGEDGMKLMNWPAPGTGMENRVFRFTKEFGQLLGRGEYETLHGLAEAKMPISKNISIEGEAEYRAYRGKTSVVTFSLKQEPGPTTRMIIEKHDIRLPGSLDHLEMPDSSIVKEGKWLVINGHHYISFPQPCEKGLEFENCDSKVDWYPNKMYLSLLTTDADD